jgi:hypothetical protein
LNTITYLYKIAFREVGMSAAVPVLKVLIILVAGRCVPARRAVAGGGLMLDELQIHQVPVLFGGGTPASSARCAVYAPCTSGRPADPFLASERRGLGPPTSTTPSGFTTRRK